MTAPSEPAGGAHTPGPWEWMGNGQHNVYLATTHSGRLHVMGFRRFGIQGAQPTFQVKGRMVPAVDLLKFDVGNPAVTGLAAARANDSVYRYDIASIDHPDARLIAAAPLLLEALKAMVVETVDYMTINNLGDPEQKTNIRFARAALAAAQGV